jgi:hypothetical protein
MDWSERGVVPRYEGEQAFQTLRAVYFPPVNNKMTQIT